MELRVLRYFLEVAHTGTLTAAANKLHVTQPALSRQLRSLEDELGVTLLNRNHKPLTLTTDGVYLAKQAELMLALADKTALNIKNKAAIAGNITIGAAETPIFQHIIHAMNSLQMAYPHVTFTLISGSTTDLLERLDQGVLDFLFALDFTQKASYDFLDFPDKDIRGVYINKKHPLAQQIGISSNDLLNYPVVISRQSSFNDSLVEEFGINMADLDIKINYNLLGNASLYPTLNTRAMLVGIAGIVPNQNLTFKPFIPESYSIGTIIWPHTPFLSSLHETFITYLTDELNDSGKNSNV